MKQIKAFLQGSDGEEIELVINHPDPQSEENELDITVALPRGSFPIVLTWQDWVRIVIPKQ